MNGSLTLLLTIGITAVAASGCALHGAMHGGGGHSTHGAAATIKEVQADLAVVTLQIPPLLAAQDSLLSVVVRDVQSRQPVPDATVGVTVRRVQDASSEPSGHAGHGLAGDGLAAVFEQGEYRIRRRFDAAGDYEITATVEIPGRGAPLTVTATSSVVQHGGHGTAPWLTVVAGASMAVMMLLMSMP